MSQAYKMSKIDFVDLTKYYKMSKNLNIDFFILSHN